MSVEDGDDHISDGRERQARDLGLLEAAQVEQVESTASASHCEKPGVSDDPGGGGAREGSLWSERQSKDDEES